MSWPLPKVWTVVAVVLALLLSVVGVQSWRLSHASQLNDALQLNLKDKDGIIKDKGQQLADKNSQLLAVSLVSSANDRAQRDLRQRAETLQVQLAARQDKIKELINENAELKHWTDTLLPADIVRLHNRPALAGAAAYRAWLSENNALPVSGDASINQR